MAEKFGIQNAVQRVQLNTQLPPVQAAAVAAPGLARVPLPPRDASEERVKPRKAANQFQSPRGQEAGLSPVATAPLISGFAGYDALTASPTTLQGAAGAPVEERGANQGQHGVNQLPSAANLVAFARTPRGEVVYLERERLEGHIIPAHITDPPTARGKRTTTWWPVLHSATGAQTMTVPQVVGVIMDAVAKGDWQNAPRGTMLSVYDLPADQASRYGVSEVKVSAAPDGRILSAYPSRGSNVLAVKELTAQEQAAFAAPVAATQHGDDDRLFKTNLPQTTFG